MLRIVFIVVFIIIKNSVNSYVAGAHVKFIETIQICTLFFIYHKLLYQNDQKEVLH